MLLRSIVRGPKRSRLRWRHELVAVTTTLACALAWSERAHAADEPTEAVSIAYAADASCPDGISFFGEVASRTSRVRVARRGEAARKVRVHIARDAAESFSGRLTIDGATGAHGSREVFGETCQEVVDAIAFLAARGVDPSASRWPIHARRHTIDEAPPPPAKVASRGVIVPWRARRHVIDELPPAPLDVVPDVAVATSRERHLGIDVFPPAIWSVTQASPALRAHEIDELPPPIVGVGRDQRDGVERLPSSALRPRFGLGTQVEASGLAGTVPMARVLAEMDFDSRNKPIVAPSVRVGFASSVDVSRDLSAGRTKLQWTLATIEPCPVRFRIVEGVAIRPCAGFSGGFLGVEGFASDNSRSRTRPWFAVSGQVRVSWEVASVLALDLEGGVVAPLVRESFWVSPQAAPYTAPTVAMLGRAGASVHFP